MGTDIRDDGRDERDGSAVVDAEAKDRTDAGTDIVGTVPMKDVDDFNGGTLNSIPNCNEDIASGLDGTDGRRTSSNEAGSSDHSSAGGIDVGVNVFDGSDARRVDDAGDGGGGGSTSGDDTRADAKIDDSVEMVESGEMGVKERYVRTSSLSRRFSSKNKYRSSFFLPLRPFCHICHFAFFCIFLRILIFVNFVKIIENCKKIRKII